MKVTARYQPLSATASRASADALLTWLRQFGEHRVNSRLIDERRSVPPHVALEFGNRGLFGVQVDESHGGLALRSRDVARVLEQAAAIDLGLGTWLLTSLFPGVRPISAFSTGALRDEWLPRLAAGRVLAGYAQTEPVAGTNFPAMAARAQVVGGGWRVTGDKVWIGNATWAGLLTVMAHEIDETGRRRGLVALAVPTDRPGVSFGREILSLGMRGMVQSEIHFRDVPVGPDSLLGSGERGLEVGVDSMSWSRFAIAATCVGSMKRCVQLAVRFASRRTIATGRVLDHPVIRVYIGETAAMIAGADALLRRVSEVIDRGEGVAAEIFAACKLSGAEFLWCAADRLVQTLGGRGYDEANEAPQILRDARVTRIFEGPSEPLEAFLGASALLPASDLQRFLREELAGGSEADALDASVAELRKRVAGGAVPAGGARAARAWECALAGRAAMWALVTAAAGQDVARSAAPEGELATAWLRRRFEQACHEARSGLAAETAMIDPPAAEKLAEAYAAGIGDVEQQLPGERHERDPLLRREPPR